MDKITSARIVPSDPREGRFQAEIFARFGEDSEEKRVLSFYDDELSFTAEEVVGLTMEEVGDLFCRKDSAYLRS